jgi:hypothetical protein
MRQPHAALTFYNRRRTIQLEIGSFGDNNLK